MSAVLLAVLSAFAGVVGAVFGDMMSEEVRRRLDRVPLQLMRLACRRLPEPARTDRTDEWAAELHAILARRGATRLPITRLIVGIRFALGLFIATPAIRRTVRSQRANRGGASAWVAAAVALPLLVVALGAAFNVLLAGLLMFAVLVRVVGRALRFQDSRARSAALALAPFAGLFVVSLAHMINGESLPAFVSVTAGMLLMFQPSLALRFTQHIRPVARAPKALVVVVCAAAAIVVGLAPRPMPEAALFTALAAVTLIQLATGFVIIAGSFRCPVADQRAKLMISGVATTLFGVALAGLGGGPGPAAASRFMVLVAAVGYLLIVAPPRRLRLPWRPKESTSPA